ncbi:hypothetical protein HPB49_012056 [Dermacentor silvarum]|uniref:Uncharacterized protein n=1 Tax=Dermacentor silvarum TaxID=543639 RepID=A0ACB8D5A4_DERSI|nr:hypothetical protein HPB49_012056 [Dermacentor silvarum]
MREAIERPFDVDEEHGEVSAGPAPSKVETTSAMESAVHLQRRKPVCWSARNPQVRATHSSRARAMASITLQAAEVRETGRYEDSSPAGFLPFRMGATMAVRKASGTCPDHQILL